MRSERFSQLAAIISLRKFFVTSSFSSYFYHKDELEQPGNLPNHLSPLFYLLNKSVCHFSLVFSFRIVLCYVLPLHPHPHPHPNPSHTTSWIAGLSQRRFPSEFVLDKVALVQVLFRAFQFSCQYYSTNAHLNLQRRCYKKGKQAKSEDLS